MIRIITILLITITFNTIAQSPQFTLQRSLPQLANSGFTGSSQVNRLVIGSSFESIGKNFYALSNYIGYDQYVKKLHGGLGVEINQSIFGNFDLQGSTQFMVNYAYHQSITRKLNLSVGIGGGVSSMFNHFIFTDEFGTVINDTTSHSTKFRWKTGLVLHTANFYFGAQYIPKIEFRDLLEQVDQSLLTVFIGGDLKPFENKSLSISPSLLYTNQNSFQNINFQLAFSTARFGLGINTTFRDNFSVFGALYFNRFDLKYNINNDISPLSSNSQFGHELVFKYKFKSGSLPIRTSFFGPKLF